MPAGSVNTSVGAPATFAVYAPGTVTAPKVWPALSVSVSTRFVASAELVTTALSV